MRSSIRSAEADLKDERSGNELCNVQLSMMAQEPSGNPM